MNKTFALIVLSSVAACGSLVENTDKPSGIYVAGAESISGDFGVTLATKAPASGVHVEGVSCKNKIWDSAPTNEAALSVLRRETAKAGYNTVYVTSVEPAEDALLMNCWTAIRATGTAFNR
ncbi:hypothetical protein TG4357_00475 [Thalassovita gelatinovora]|uniref:Lipoprotein n=1 Tax=Thalassovita gelatinovora TaxID=53501 RepID=A0A0P1F5E1_THAGE|nr:hypothetical protein [Thalassovita gelatinovora]QIZ79593.1 hypothetical protein HFZ77_03410 [Thalassovita gelatinovora]CUH63093.1 hypothetical protein TG4357_00475 [Thalassovita gelatinovora]SEQ15649.1 hypothetical protein SAMN04488043_103375 [Thalassovita gelatinovora]